jgi:hypothetical protein
MVTGMDSLLAQGRRGELAQEIYSGRLERELRKVHRPGRGRRWAFWRAREIQAPAGIMHILPKIRCLHDAGAPAHT